MSAEETVPKRGSTTVEDTAPETEVEEDDDDFEIDFEAVRERRERARAAKIAQEQKEREEAEAKAAAEAAAAAAAAEAERAQAAGKEADEADAPDAARRPKSGDSSTPARTTASSAADTTGGATFSWLTGYQTQASGDALEEEEEKVKQHFYVGKKRLTQWKFDTYHLTQKEYYESLLTEDSERAGEEKDADKSASSIMIFSRPQDPPDIPLAVKDLPLTDFEAKAKERAIAIFSTWLFDAGLIDELLLNGGMSAAVLGDSYETKEDEDDHFGVGDEHKKMTKMDKEIFKLRTSTERQLTLIKARLNDGVAASGNEVEELVNAVVATKDDLGRLRELTTYISNAGDAEYSNNFMINKYPHLKNAINARRNMQKCFRQLALFSQIPDTCERLRQELLDAEFTVHEWSTLRNVCREHVDLEIFLAEAEAGMKKDAETLEEEEKTDRRISSGKFSRQAFLDGGKDNNEEVDRFLKEHVYNIRELGDELRTRIIFGMGGAFDLAMSNPAGMVALIEAVEVYETSKEGYTTAPTRFTDMRATALAELYNDMQARGLEVFKGVTEAENDEPDENNEVFNAVLRAARDVTSEIGFVSNQMAPCFPPHWAIETLWTTNAAHLCSSQILKQIGGIDGQNMSELTNAQLLDLVAWVENFREIVEESFPDIRSISSKRISFDEKPQLLVDNGRAVDISVAKDTLAWVNNTLWEVHDIAKDDFMYRLSDQAKEWIGNAYAGKHTKIQTAEQRYVTSLCEDVYGVAGVQIRTIRERLTRRSMALVAAVVTIFKVLIAAQKQHRDRFLTDFETCCAASNDFIRMSEKCEDVVYEVHQKCILTPGSVKSLDHWSSQLLTLYASDSVYAGQLTSYFIFQDVEEAVGDRLFTPEWLDELDSNELADVLVQTFEDVMEDVKAWLDYVMVQKVLQAYIAASAVFYVRVLLQRASAHNNNRNSYFSDNEKATERVSGDIAILREYFQSHIEEMPTLRRTIVRDFEFLENVHELMMVATGESYRDLKDVAMGLQQRIENFQLVKMLVGDIHHLVQPNQEKQVYDLMDNIEEEVNSAYPTNMDNVKSASETSSVSATRLDQMIARHVVESPRKRQFSNKKQQEQLDFVLQIWRSSWEESEE